jgi:hypothetical protein
MFDTAIEGSEEGRVEYEEFRDSKKVISAVRSEDKTERRYIHTSY